MRTYTLGTKVVVALASALGLLAVMQRPWYGPRPEVAPGTKVALASPIESFAESLARWFGDPAGASAWQSFARADVALAVLALVAGTAAVACLEAGVEQAARNVLQVSSLGICALLAVKFVDQPGPNAAVEPRYGLFVALGLAATLLITASGVQACALQARRSGPRAVRSKLARR
jgi:hypothetical protein